VRNHIKKGNTPYKVRVDKHKKKLEFSPRDLVWLHLKKERFPFRRKNKLMVRGDGLFNIIQNVADNAYVLQFP